MNNINYKRFFEYLTFWDQYFPAHPFESTKSIKLNHGHGTPQLPLASFSLLARYHAPLRLGTAGASYTCGDSSDDTMQVSRAGWSRVDWELPSFGGTEPARNDNGGAATQPLSGQPTIRPAAPSRRYHPRTHPHRVGEYRERGCVYRHAADKLVGVSAGGITSFGKKHPLFLSFSLALSISPHSEGWKITGWRWRMHGADVPRTWRSRQRSR